MAERYDYLFKFIIIGDAATGKSCLLHRFIDDKCKSGYSRPISDLRKQLRKNQHIPLVSNLDPKL